MTPEEGVVDEVAGDITTLPTNIKKIFSICNDSQEVVVFTAQVKNDETILVPPHVIDLKWCAEGELDNFDDLAFEHEDILKKYLSARDASIE